MVLHAAEMEVQEVRLGGSKGQIGVWVLACGLQVLCSLCKRRLELIWGQGRRAASGTGIMFVPQPMRLGAAPAAATATACAAAAFQLSQTELRHPQSTIHEPHATPFQARPPCGPTRSS